MFEKVTWSRVTQWQGLSKTCVKTFGSVGRLQSVPPGRLALVHACIPGNVMGSSVQKADSEMEVGVQEVS